MSDSRIVGVMTPMSNEKLALALKELDLEMEGTEFGYHEYRKLYETAHDVVTAMPVLKWIPETETPMMNIMERAVLGDTHLIVMSTWDFTVYASLQREVDTLYHERFLPLHEIPSAKRLEALSPDDLDKLRLDRRAYIEKSLMAHGLVFRTKRKSK